ncbi:hypothetical protein [Thalassoporum mexicanum]|nr:hypothetical protein [Pseudanabaena sp. PCC 7367]
MLIAVRYGFMDCMRLFPVDMASEFTRLSGSCRAYGMKAVENIALNCFIG